MHRTGLEPVTTRFEAGYSIRLSYRCIEVENLETFNKITLLKEEMEETEGIVLKSIDFKDHERIITIFTRDLGIASLIVKGVRGGNLQKLAITTPFCQVEFLYSRGKSELLRYHDSTVLHEHHELRTQYAHLEAAGLMAKAILQFQLPGTPAPTLYALFERYLKKIPEFPNPLPLTTSFLLKMLHLEGLISEDSHDGRITSTFTSAEKEILKELIQSRSFQKLSQLPVTPEFAKKISDFFASRIQGD